MRAIRRSIKSTFVIRKAIIVVLTLGAVETDRESRDYQTG